LNLITFITCVKNEEINYSNLKLIIKNIPTVELDGMNTLGLLLKKVQLIQETMKKLLWKKD